LDVVIVARFDRYARSTRHLILRWRSFNPWVWTSSASTHLRRDRDKGFLNACVAAVSSAVPFAQ
jgi:hypothetical protein